MKNQIREIVEEFLSKLSVDFDEVIVHDEGGGSSVRFAIKSNDSGILIGKEGGSIKALNYVIKQIVWKKTDNEARNINFFIDVNDYQSQNIERIKSKAVETAEKAIVFKRDIEMEPASSFERMITHSTLADNPNVTTESSGEGVFRRVNIIYKI